MMEDWQRDDFAALDSGAHQHAYLERPRGHAKTFDLGTEAVAELVLGRPGQRLFCAAADEDQARLLFEDVADKFRRSPLLRGSVRIMQREIIVTATGSRLKVLSSDAPTAYGLRPDWIAVDELAEWRRRELWDSLWTATGKRPGCRMLVITTAGWDFAGIAWEVRQAAQQEADWYFSARGQCASWLRPEWLDQQRRTLPAHVFARLHESRWVEGAGAFLLASEVDAIFMAEVPTGPGPVAVGLDLGLARDAAVAALARQFGAPVVLDPWQGVLMGQRLRTRGVRVEEYQFTAEGRCRLFSVLLDLIRTGRLRSRPHEALRRELLGLEVAETSAGWRVDHRPGRHDDHAIAVGLAAQQVAAAPVLAGRWSDVAEVNAELHEAAQVWPGDTVLGQRRPRGL